MVLLYLAEVKHSSNYFSRSDIVVLKVNIYFNFVLDTGTGKFNLMRPDLGQSETENYSHFVNSK